MKNKTPNAAVPAGARTADASPKPARAKAVAPRPAAKPRGKSTAGFGRDAGQAATEPGRERGKPEAGAPRRKPKQPKQAKPNKQAKPSKKLEVRLLLDDLARLDALKQRAAAAGRRSKRSELLRAGLVLLQGLDPLSLCDALEALPVRRKAKVVPLPSLLGTAPAKRKTKPR